MGTKKYNFKIKTADEYKAGTDSNIFVVLYGELGETDEVRLNGYISGNAFERNDTDKFSINLKDVGNIYQIALRSDTRYAGSDWLLSYIEVQCEGSSYTTHFTINEWIKDTKTKIYSSTDLIHNNCTYQSTSQKYKEYIVTVPSNGSYNYAHTEKITKSSCYKNSTTKVSSTEFNAALESKRSYSASIPIFEGLDLKAASENFLRFAFKQGFSSTVVDELVETDGQDITKSVSLTLHNPTNENKYYLMTYQVVVIDALVSTGDIAAQFSVEQSLEFTGAKEITPDEAKRLSDNPSICMDNSLIKAH